MELVPGAPLSHSIERTRSQHEIAGILDQLAAALAGGASRRYRALRYQAL